MKKENCLRTNRPKRKKIINIRISNELGYWLRKEQLSPTAIFYEACKELGYTEKE